MKINNISSENNFGLRINGLKKDFLNCFNASKKDYLKIKSFLKSAGYDDLKLLSIERERHAPDLVYLRFMPLDQGAIRGFSQKAPRNASLEEIKKTLLEATEWVAQCAKIKK